VSVGRSVAGDAAPFDVEVDASSSSPDEHALTAIAIARSAGVTTGVRRFMGAVLFRVW
jgi:hypothetical protein